ncbi:hypothetical protein [Pseudobacillus badius]|uniref:hypothetical protein n=1 Tax=Bacillus badius TaxID=1455 RepID=UPI0007B358C9|nr:hypothetical protein [Bacillus badius]KZR59790.1 hypothetical protein A3781_12100 [Bacillus badius]
MKGLDDKLKGYDDLSYEKINGTRFQLKDKQLNKRVVFNLKGVTITPFIHTDSLIEKLEKMNDFKYVEGHGFYLDGYAEFSITGFMDYMDEQIYRGSFEIGKVYSFGSYHFEISTRSDLFSFLTWFEDESKSDFYTLKLYGVSKEKFSIEIEKSLFYIGAKFLDDIDEEYREFLYPRIMDFRMVGITTELFNYTEIDLSIDWSSPITNNLSLFNHGESTDDYNFFAYYRFIETFFGDGNEEDELIALVESIDVTELLGFAKDNQLIEANGTEKSLAKLLYQIRNNYIHHKLSRERLFDPTFNIPIQILTKWKVITREMAIQLFNLHCRHNN